MTLPARFSCFLLLLSSLFSTAVAAQSGLIQQADNAPATLNEVHLSDFGLLEGYVENAEAAGLPVVVKKNGPAFQAGVEDMDILTTINGTPVQTFQEVRMALLATHRGEPVRFQFLRGAEERAVEMTLSDRPRAAPVELIFGFEFAKCYGLEVENYQQSENGGVLVRRVEAGSSGATAGLQPGDVVIAFNTQPITLWSEWYRLLLQAPYQQPVLLTVNRGDQPLDLPLLNTICHPQLFPKSAPMEARPESLGILQRIEESPGLAAPPGILIGNVMPGSRATLAGLVAGDRIVEIGQRKITNTFEFVRLLDGLERTRQPVALRVLRNNAPLSVVIPPAQQSPAVPAAAPAPALQEEHTLQPRVFRAFPNPTSGLFTLEFSALPAPLRVQVFNLNGQLLFAEDEESFAGDFSRQFDFRGQPPGAVFVRVEQNGQVYSRIVLIQ